MEIIVNCIIGSCLGTIIGMMILMALDKLFP